MWGPGGLGSLNGPGCVCLARMVVPSKAYHEEPADQHKPLPSPSLLFLLWLRSLTFSLVFLCSTSLLGLFLWHCVIFLLHNCSLVSLFHLLISLVPLLSFFPTIYIYPCLILFLFPLTFCFFPTHHTGKRENTVSETRIYVGMEGEGGRIICEAKWVRGSLRKPNLIA